jgi:hypothetical protein
VPYSALVSDTRYSEGMVKRGVAAAVASGVVVQRASPGRAPAYAFSDWALGRGEVPRDVARLAADVPSIVSAAPAPAPYRHSEHRPAPPLPGTDTTTVLRASIAGVSFEVPAASGGELVVETVVDGRPVTARLTLPAARDERRSAG